MLLSFVCPWPHIHGLATARKKKICFFHVNFSFSNSNRITKFGIWVPCNVYMPPDRVHLTFSSFHGSVIKVKVTRLGPFLKYYKQYVNYMWCIEWLERVHVRLAGVVLPWFQFHGSLVNKIKNGNGECVKDTTTQQRAEKSWRPPIGLQHSKKIPHFEGGFSLPLNKMLSFL